MNTSELLYILALQRVPNLGDSSARKLIARFGSAEAVFKAKKSQLLKISGIGELRIRELQDSKHLKAAETELDFIQRENIKPLYFQEEDYPARLKHCHDAPLLLFSRGNIQLKNQKILSIVGTRKITPQGIAFCENLIEELSLFKPVIVSGFAYGVDITAQKAAIKHGLQTIGCLAHGLNQIYPRQHAKYVKQIEENGGFLTDFWSSDDFDRNNFLKRNRIIAGLSEATLVIESAEKGGSLVTADIANSYNREVFAVPGRPTDYYSLGCNNLIKTQNAHLLNSAADLIYMLGWKTEESPKPVQKQLFIELDPEESKVMEYLQNSGKSQLDHIALNCGFPSFKTAGILINMELKGVVRPLPGKLFEAV